MFSIALCIIFYTEAARGRPSDWKLDLSLTPFTLGFPVVMCIISGSVPAITFSDTCKILQDPPRLNLI